MEAGAIAGIVLASLALLLVVGFVVYWYWWKPHHNKTGDSDSSALSADFDEKTRHKKILMEMYHLDDDENDEGMETYNDNDFRELP